MIGSHAVIFDADPHSETVWGAPFNTNPEFTSNLAGWWPGNGTTNVWTWAAGQNSGASTASVAELVTFASPNVLRPAGTALLRLTALVTVTNPSTTQLVLRLGYGLTSTSWLEYHETVLPINKPGTYTLELISDPSTISANRLYLRPEFRARVPVTALATQTVAIDYIRLQSAGAAALTADLSCLVDEVTIQHGRGDSDGQPDASSCTLDLSVEDDDDWPAIVEVGGVIRVTTTLPTASSVRFVGRVTDITQGWDEAGDRTPDRPVGQVIATGVLADLGRRVVGAAPWPQELDGARVARIMSAAGITLDPAKSDPGTVQILPRDVDSQPALDVAQAVAQDAGGLLWETRDGQIRYADADHRRGTIPALALDACDVLITPTWRRTTEGLVNSVSIGYGPTPEGGEQPRYVDTRPESITLFGTYGFTAATQLAALGDAEAMGQLLLTRNAEPVWIMAALPVDLGGLSEDETAAALGLELNDLVNLTGLPAAGSVPTSSMLWVEGWTETLAWGVHDFVLVISGYCRSAPAPRWDDVDPEWLWDSMGEMTWDDATCMGPPASLGRWNDVPASLRWNGVDPAITWDTWPG